MFLDEVDLDVSNEDPAQKRQHSARAGLDRVKGLNVASMGGTDSVMSSIMSKHKEEKKPFHRGYSHLQSLKEHHEKVLTHSELTNFCWEHESAVCRVTLSETIVPLYQVKKY